MPANGNEQPRFFKAREHALFRIIRVRFPTLDAWSTWVRSVSRIFMNIDSLGDDIVGNGAGRLSEFSGDVDVAFRFS